MNQRLFLCLAASVCVAAAATGQPPPPVSTAVPASPAPAKPATEPSFGPLPAFTRLPNSKVDMRGLMWRMNHYVAGERVMSVGYGEFRDDVPWDDEAFKKERTLIGRLQMVSAKESPRKYDLIPFKVGAAYVVAPDTRDEANLDLSGMSEFDLSSRGLLMDQALLSIPENQLAALGSDRGIAVSSLPKSAQAAIARAFRPPLQIRNHKPSTYKTDDGLERASIESEDKGSLDEPLDWSATRIRARLSRSGVFVDLKPYGASIGQNDTGLVFENTVEQNRGGQNRGVDMPLFSEVANRFKPSDLTGKAFTQPLNYAGVWTVQDVVKQISKVTGLKLTVSKPYQDDAVFIGSNALTAGEAIDGLRLALTASWRKLGTTYILAWDRLGIQAVQLLAKESAEVAAKAVKKTRRTTDTATGWVKIADLLPFDKSDPMSLTDDQRGKVFGAAADARPRFGSDAGRISFTEMTPEQQGWVRAAAAKDSVDLPATSDGQPTQKRPFTDDDIQKAYMSGDCWVGYSVEVPGVGWVRSSRGDSQPVSPWNIATARAKLNSDPNKPKRDVMADAPPEVREMLEHPKPVTPPAPVRGLMVPPLRAARLNELAGEMKRHGLNILFYPVLFNGYGTFAGKAFALHPSLQGTDGWAAAVAAMEPAGIKVVGYLNTLAWQDLGTTAHYLTKHLDWLDVDVAGRPRLAWFVAHPDAAIKAASLGVLPSNYVRPLEPVVSQKLQILVDEFAKKPGAAGICFAEWMPPSVPSMGGPFGSVNTPPLGYGVADRLAALQRTGEDPVDRLLSWDDYVPPSLADRRSSMMRDSYTKEPSPYQVLLEDLLKRAKAARKGWKTWLVNGHLLGDMQPGGSELDVGKAADEIIGSVFGMFRGGTKQGALLPITSQNLLATLGEEDMGGNSEIPESVLKMPPIALYNIFFAQIGHEGAGVPRMQMTSVVYDFRTSPEQITSSLQWIKAPDKEPPAKKPGG